MKTPPVEKLYRFSYKTAEQRLKTGAFYAAGIIEAEEIARKRAATHSQFLFDFEIHEVKEQRG